MWKGEKWGDMIRLYISTWGSQDHYELQGESCRRFKLNGQLCM